MPHPAPIATRLRVAPGSVVDLRSIDPSATPDAPGDKDGTAAAADALRDDLADLQDRLWAESSRSVLVVFQGIDASGKDGVIKKVFSGLNPQACRVTSFKQPTDDERARDFLWRVHRAVPTHGEIGIFNRSHYEDVLVVRVRGLVEEDVWRARYAAINDFERLLAGDGSTSIVKVFLHISKDEQAARFQKRLDNPSKRWKFRKGDLEERDRWEAYEAAFQEAIERTSTDIAPWYVVPADRKWYRDFAVLSILVETLRDLDPRYPDPEDGLDEVVVR